MWDNSLAQATLDEIKRLSIRFGGVEGGVSTLDNRMSKLEAGMSNLEGRMSKLDAGMSNVEGRMSKLEAGMSKLEARVSNVEIRISTLERRMGNIEDVVAALNTEIRTWPDMHFLGAAAKLQMTHTREIKTEVADIGVRVKEIFQAMATDPEIKSLREEVSRFRDRSLTIEVRLGALEGRLGVKHEVDA